MAACRTKSSHAGTIASEDPASLLVKTYPHFVHACLFTLSLTLKNLLGNNYHNDCRSHIFAEDILSR